MVNKHKQKKKKIFRAFRKINKKLNALIEKNQKFVKNKKRRETEKELHHFKEMQFPIMKVKRVVPAWQKAWEVEKFRPLALNKNLARTNYLLHV